MTNEKSNEMFKLSFMQDVTPTNRQNNFASLSRPMSDFSNDSF